MRWRVQFSRSRNVVKLSRWFIRVCRNSEKSAINVPISPSSQNASSEIWWKIVRNTENKGQNEMKQVNHRGYSNAPSGHIKKGNFQSKLRPGGCHVELHSWWRPRQGASDLPDGAELEVRRTAWFAARLCVLSLLTKSTCSNVFKCCVILQQTSVSSSFPR